MRRFIQGPTPGPRPTGTRDFEGYHDNAARLQVLVKPNKDVSALFNIHARDLDNNATLFRANIIAPGTNQLVGGFERDTIAIDGDNFQDLDSRGGSARRGMLGLGPSSDSRAACGRALTPRT